VLHVGVDEAGYGPLLGPLVVGVAALRLTDEPEPGTTDLRARLKGLVVRRPRDARANAAKRLPVPVDDSKAIHRRFGLTGLARGLGAFTAAMNVPPPADLEDLVTRFSDRDPREFGVHPWYGRLGAARVPRYPWTGPLDARFEARGVQALDLRVLPLCASDFNAQVATYDNKASVLGLAAGTCLLSILDRHPGEDAEIVFDRQGGRTDYSGYLADLFPFATIGASVVDGTISRYEVRLPDRRLHVSFATKGDQRSLAVGWASMGAKLTRELFMHCLNAYFRDRLPDLAPTAGYTVDGRRWMKEVEPLCVDEGIDPAALVRVR